MARKISNAEIMIREEIDNMSTYKLAPTKERIEQEIKYAFWNELLCRKTYDELMKSVTDKYNAVANDFVS